MTTLDSPVSKEKGGRLESLMKEMTLEEKAALCTGEGPWTTTPIERLGIPALVLSDGPHGVRRVANLNEMASQSLPATCFPTASCLSASWDMELLHDVGVAIGEECVALDVGIILGPSNNMKRTSLCGRNFEYFAEDPYLSGELATSYINGVQSQGVGVSLKHFAANNQEFQRFSISSEVDERTLREIYFPAFEKAVKEAQPWTVMCAYNKIDGTYCSEHHELLTDILKNEWGFEGLVVSDWGAVHDRVASLEAGLDLEMPGPKNRRVQAVIEAVRSGALSEDILNESVRRILRIVFKAAEAPKGKKFDVEAHHQLARKAAGEAMVLLKNDGVLPLQNVKRIAVIGRSAKEPHFQGGGSSFINTTKTDIPFEEIQKLSSNATLSYAEGYPKDLELRQELIDEAVNIAKAAEVALIFVALPSVIESEGYDRSTLELTPQQVSLIKAVTKVQPKTVVILNNGSAITMTHWLDGTAAVLESWMMGQAGGGAIADILFGKVNPSGKNETKTVNFNLDFRAFAYYHPGYKQWITEDGEFEILIGASATDIRLQETVTLQSTLKLPSLLNTESTLKEWLDDPKGKKVLAPMVEKMTAGLTAAMGAEGEASAMGMDMMGFLMDLPLLSILHFQDQLLTISPEEQVELYLREAKS